MSTPFPVVTLNFDPYLYVFGLTFRTETFVVALALFAGIVWAGVIAGRVAIGVVARPVSRADEEPDDDGMDDIDDEDFDDDEEWEDEPPPIDPNTKLARDDLLFILLGTIPGAVLFGRLGYALLHLDWYSADPARILDLTAGSGELTMAVLGGTMTGVYVGALLDAPVSRWLWVGIRPLLLTLAIAKLGQVLGGSGQGAFVLDGSVPATAYLGSGPWGSLGADIPAVPSQVYEAAITVTILVIVGILGRVTPLRTPDGRLFAIGLGLWAFSRGLVATTWRDAPVIGTLKAEQFICLGVAAISFSAAFAIWAWGRWGRNAAPSPAPSHHREGSAEAFHPGQ